MHTTTSVTADWTHVVLNYIGTEDVQGNKIYIDGMAKMISFSLTAASHEEGDGRTVVGRYLTNVDDNYASVDIDELLFFNEALNVDQVTKIKNLT